MSRPRLAGSHLARALVVVLATSGNTGCEPPAAVDARDDGKVIDRGSITGANNFSGTRLPEIVSAGNEKFLLAAGDGEIILTSPRGSHDFDEVTYVITLDDATNYNLQFASAADREDFIIRVSFKRLYRGSYTAKAFGDKGTEAFGEASFRVTEEGL